MRFGSSGALAMCRSYGSPCRSTWLRSAAAVAMATLLTACTTVSVDRDVDNRFYGGLGLLASQLEPDADNVAAIELDDTQSAGGAIMLGYDITNRFSVEGHIADLGEATLTPRGEISYVVGGISAVFYGLNEQSDRSRREGFSAFGKFGAGVMDNDAVDVDFRRVNDFHVLVGAGLEYGLQNGLGFRAELLAHETDAKYAQLGLVFRFGGNRNGQGVSPAPDLEPKAEADVPVAPEPDTAVDENTGDPGPDPKFIEPIVTDADKDGVPDDVDQCPRTLNGVPVRTDGCPVLDGAVEGVTFKPASAELTDAAKSSLDGVAKILKTYPEVRVIVAAHTDNIGDAAGNLQLSKLRALSVARYLVEQGIRGARLRPQAFGESQPVASNQTSQGRARNRRVEISVISQ